MKKILNRVKFFFDVLVKSLTRFEYYKEIAKTKFNFSLKYLFLLFYIISLIGSLVFAVSASALILPKVPEFVATFESKATSLYPKGLVVNVEGGIVSTNQKEPYYVDTLKIFDLGNGYDHVLTIDTNAGPSDIKKYKTLALLTKNAFVTIENNGNSYKVNTIDKDTNITVDQESYNKLLSQITPYLKYVQGGLIAIIILSIIIWPIFVAGLSLLGQLIYLFIFSALFFILVKLMKKGLTFKKLYQLAMHASTLPILLGLIVSTLGITMPFLLGSAILFVFMILVINQF